MKFVALLLAVLAAAQPPSPEPLLAKLHAYLLAYEPALSELMADESMSQEIRRGGLYIDDGVTLDSRKNVRQRIIGSEVAFIALPQNAGWLGIRHVKAVNNKPVALSDSSLSATLTAPGLEGARALLTASAAHNLGLPRTTNLPNLPLEFLHPRNRQRFLARTAGEETIRGVRTAHLIFLERVTPSLIRNPDSGADMPSVVHAWIEPASGRLIRAVVRTFAAPGAAEHEHEVRVEFAHNKALNVMVPVEMREAFPVEGKGGGTSVARYANFRRFQTSARILPQP